MQVITMSLDSLCSRTSSLHLFVHCKWYTCICFALGKHVLANSYMCRYYFQYISNGASQQTRLPCDSHDQLNILLGIHQWKPWLKLERHKLIKSVVRPNVPELNKVLKTIDPRRNFVGSYQRQACIPTNYFPSTCTFITIDEILVS